MKFTKEILERYFKGNCSDEEIEFIHQNIDRIKDQESILFPEQEWIDADNLSEYPNAEQIKKRIASYIANSHRQHRVQTRRIILTWSAVAASVVLLISTIFYFSQTVEQHSVEPDIVQLDTSTSDSPPNLYFINSGKDIIYLTAADSSIISLYPQSEIKFAEHFDRLASRDFFLKGKAKFSVAKDKDKPFNVHSSGMTTTALGTIFTVDEFSNSITHVKLLAGSVEIKPAASKKSDQITHVLMPNEEIELDHKKAKILHTTRSPVSPTDRRGYFRETPQKVVFKNLALEEVFLIMKQNYAIDIRYNEAQIQQKFYSGSFLQGADVYQKILDEIKYLHQIDLEIY